MGVAQYIKKNKRRKSDIIRQSNDKNAWNITSKNTNILSRYVHKSLVNGDFYSNSDVFVENILNLSKRYKNILKSQNIKRTKCMKYILVWDKTINTLVTIHKKRGYRNRSNNLGRMERVITELEITCNKRK